jgi:hypothetical protein
MKKILNRVATFLIVAGVLSSIGLIKYVTQISLGEFTTWFGANLIAIAAGGLIFIINLDTETKK